MDLFVLGAFPLYLLYVGNGFFRGSGDSLATRRLPSLILQQGTIDLAHTPPFDQRDQRHYSVLWFDEKTLPSFPLGTAFLAVPYTAVALAATGGELGSYVLRPDDDPERFAEFRRRYRAELRESPRAEALDHLRALAKRRNLTLLTATKSAEISEAAVLHELLDGRIADNL